VAAFNEKVFILSRTVIPLMISFQERFNIQKRFPSITSAKKYSSDCQKYKALFLQFSTYNVKTSPSRKYIPGKRKSEMTPQYRITITKT